MQCHEAQLFQHVTQMLSSWVILQEARFNKMQAREFGENHIQGNQTSFP